MRQQVTRRAVIHEGGTRERDDDDEMGERDDDPHVPSCTECRWIECIRRAGPWGAGGLGRNVFGLTHLSGEDDGTRLCIMYFRKTKTVQQPLTHE